MGFSPTKDTEFRAGDSDLDVAITDGRIFKLVWKDLLECSPAFRNEFMFGTGEEGRARVARIKDMLTRRGVIHFHDLPRIPAFEPTQLSSRTVSQIYASILEDNNKFLYERIRIRMEPGCGRFTVCQVKIMENDLKYQVRSREIIDLANAMRNQSLILSPYFQ